MRQRFIYIYMMGFLDASMTFNSRTKINKTKMVFYMNNHENIRDNWSNESIRGYNLEKKGRIVGGKSVFYLKEAGKNKSNNPV